LEDEFAENSSGSTAPEAQKMPILSVFSAGGAEGGRTPDLLIANEELVTISGGGNLLAQSPNQLVCTKNEDWGTVWGERSSSKWAEPMGLLVGSTDKQITICLSVIF
jgi:hypothetical protein